MTIGKRVLSVIMAMIMVFSVVQIGVSAIDVSTGEAVVNTQVMTDDGTGRLVIPQATVTATSTVRVAAAEGSMETGDKIVPATPSGIPQISGSYTKEAYAGETPTRAQIIFNCDLSLAATKDSVVLTCTNNSSVTFTKSNPSNNQWVWTITGGTASAGSYLDFKVTYNYKYTDSLTGQVITKAYEAYGSAYVEGIAQPAGYFMDLYRTKPPFHSGTYHDVVYRILGLNTYGSYYPTGADDAGNLKDDVEHYSHGYFDFVNDTEKWWERSAANAPGYGLVLCCYDNGDGGKTLRSGSLDRQRPISTTYIDSSQGTALNGSNINLRYAVYNHNRRGNYKYQLNSGAAVAPGEVVVNSANNPDSAAQIGFAAQTTTVEYENNGGYLTSSPYAILNGNDSTKVYGLSVPFTGTTYANAAATQSDGTKFIEYTFTSTLQGRYIETDRMVSGTSAVTLKFYIYNKAELRGVINEALTDHIPVSPTGTEIGITPQSWFYSQGWSEFKTALTNAQRVNAKANVTQANIDAAAAALETATANLVVAKANYTTAQNYINELVNKDSSLYTAESWARVQNARRALGNLDYTVFYQSKVDSLTAELAAAIAALEFRPADFEQVDQAIEAAEAINRNLYTPESLGFLDSLVATANSAEFRALNIESQEYIDNHALAILDAIEHLVVAPADYSRVDEAIAAANALTRAKYTTASLRRVDNAVDAVIPGLNKNNQGMVDQMADDIFDAIGRLVENPADYTRVNALVTQARALTAANYTAATWGALQSAINAVDYDLKYSQQAQVDAFATEIEARLGALEYVVGDYSAVESAKARFRNLNQSWYTPESYASVQAKVDAVVYGITVDRQAEINAFATAINNAIDNDLVLVDANYSQVAVQKNRYEALDTSLYTASSLLTARQKYMAIVDGLKINEQARVDQMANDLKTALDNLQYKPGNYANVNAALDAANQIIRDAEAYAASYNNNSYYTAETYNALVSAKNAVVTGLTIEEQSRIDGFAAAINQAIAGLQNNIADYTAVNAAVAEIPADLNSGRYVPAGVTAVNNANSAIVTGLLTDEQETVDGYATALRAALAQLEVNGADYSAVTAAINSIPTDLSIYTSESVATLNAAKNAVQYGLSIDNQAIVDSFAAAILRAIAGLTLDLANYDVVVTAKTAANAALTGADAPYYTDASKQAVTDAVNAVEYGLPAAQQGRVNGFATAINAAVAALAYKPIDASAFIEIKTAFDEMDKSIYTEESVAVVSNKIAEGEAFLAGNVNIKNQAQLDNIVADIDEAIRNLAMKGANYNAVTAALEGFEAIDSSLYSNYDAVQAELEALDIDWTLDITQQATVDAYVPVIEEIITHLTFKAINTDEYEAVKATIPADLSSYTEASVAFVDAQIAAIEAFLAGDVNINDQAALDAMVDELEARIIALAKKPANYDALDALLTQFAGLNEADYTNYFDSFMVYSSISGWRKNNGSLDIDSQSVVDEKTALLQDAIDALIPVPTGYFRVREGSTAIISGKYITGLKTNLTAGNLRNTFLDYDGVTVTFEKANPGFRYYGTGSKVIVEYPDGTVEEYIIVIYGDVDGDSTISVDDAALVSSAAAGLTTLTAVQNKAGNVDGVRGVRSDDLAVISAAASLNTGINQVDPTLPA